jgi:hypothetical protein
VQEGPSICNRNEIRSRSFNLEIATRTPNRATAATVMTMQRRRAKQGSGALHLGFRTGRRIQPPQAIGEELPNAPRLQAERHHRGYPTTAAVAGEAGAVTPRVQPERAPPQRSRGTRRGLALSLASTAGRERQHHQRTAPPSISTSLPRPARRKNDEAAPQAQRDDDDDGLLGSVGLLRRSPLPPEKQATAEPTLKLGSGRSRS